jgi:hypothetical protein
LAAPTKGLVLGLVKRLRLKNYRDRLLMDDDL